ncbi:MAG: YihY/virulence factor BrkB family protein [Sphingomicrobium sp.]
MCLRRGISAAEAEGIKLAITDHDGALNEGAATGREAGSPIEMPAKAWRQVVARAWRRSWEENIGLVAAGTAFYGFIAIVPILIVSAILYSSLADPAAVVRNAGRLGTILPPGGVDAVTAQLERIVSASARARGLGFLGAIAVALFGARNAATALIAALNIAYDEEEKRGLARLSLVALTIMGAGFGLAFALLILLGFLGTLNGAIPELGTAGGIALQVAGLAIALLLSATGAATLYRFAPCRAKAKWKWVTPGSLFAAIAWLVLTMTFSFYVTRSGNFKTNYGPAASGIVVLVWLYFSALVFVFGAEINAELERQMAEDTTEGGHKPLGSRGAEAADEVAED